jgi:hypothetical protein
MLFRLVHWPLNLQYITLSLSLNLSPLLNMLHVQVYRKLAKDRKPLSGDGNDSSNNDAAEEALDTNANNGDGLSVGDGSDVNDGSDGRGDASDQG